MNLQKIAPKSTDRATLYGWTGCGKTVLAKHLLALRHDVPVWVFDWKALIRWEGYQRYTTLKSFLDAQPVRGIYAPSIKENQNEDFYERFFKACYLKKKIQVYVDEVYSVVRNDEIPYWYQACITRGREQGTSLYQSTQRPMDIPQITMSESNHHYVFAMQMPQDRKKIERMTSCPAELQSDVLDLDTHNFFHVDSRGKYAQHKLKIVKG